MGGQANRIQKERMRNNECVQEERAMVVWSIIAIGFRPRGSLRSDGDGSLLEK